MAKNKTATTNDSVDTFIATVKDETRRKDAVQLVELFREHTGFEPKMYGPSIIGFGNYHYKYPSGHEGDAPLAAFSPRSTSMVLYLSANFEDREDLLKAFGKHTTTKGCVYFKKLADVDTEVLMQMVMNCVAHTRSLYPD